MNLSYFWTGKAGIDRELEVACEGACRGLVVSPSLLPCYSRKSAPFSHGAKSLFIRNERTNRRADSPQLQREGVAGVGQRRRGAILQLNILCEDSVLVGYIKVHSLV